MKAWGPLEDFYAGAWPEPRTSASELSLLAIDLETTGLDDASDQVPSVGFVPVDGPDIVLTEALAALMARVLLAYFATIQEQFLSRACESHFWAPLVAPTIDTLALHRQLLSQGFDDEPRGNQLRLWNAKERYGLPDYAVHEGLTDALACAELYLAQVAELCVLKPQPHRSLRAG